MPGQLPDAGEAPAGFGPPGASGAPFTVRVARIRITVSGIELTLDVDDDGRHASVRFGDTFDDRRFRMPLVRLPSEEGGHGVAPLLLPFDAERISLELLDQEGAPDPECSCVYDFDDGLFLSPEVARRLPLGAPLPGARHPPASAPETTGAAGWGPRGASGQPRQLQLAGLAERPSGELDLRLSVDDGGAAARLRLALPARRKPLDLALTRPPDRPAGPAVASLVLPAGSPCLGLEFLDAGGEPLPGLDCRLVVRSRTFIAPGSVVPSAAPDAEAAPPAEVLSAPSDAAAGPAGCFARDHLLSVVGLRPAGGGLRCWYVLDEPGRFHAVRWATNLGQETATAPLRRAPLFGDAGPAWVELLLPADPEAVVYLEPLAADGAPDEALTAVFSPADRALRLAAEPEAPAQASAPRPGHALPPDFRLLARPALGPPGLVSGLRTVTVVGAERSGTGPLKVRLLLDDGGRHTRVCHWHEQMDYEEETVVLRATASCPAHVEVTVRDPAPRLWLDFVDAFDHATGELAGVLNLEDGALVPQRARLSPAHEKYPLRDRLLGAMKHCASCRKLVGPRDATHVADLPAAEAEILRRDFVVDFEFCNLCRECRPAIAARTGWLGRLLFALERSSLLLTLLLYLVKAYAGALLVCVSPGQFMAEFFRGSPLHAGPGAATFLAATFFASLACAVPLIAAARLTTVVSGWLVGNDLLRQFLSFIGVALLTLLGAMEAYFTFARPPLAPEDTPLLLWDLFFYAALSGLAVNLGLAAITGRVVTVSLRYKERIDARLQRATRLVRALHGLIAVRRSEDLVDRLRELLPEHLGAWEWQWLEVQPDGKTYKVAAAYGPGPSEAGAVPPALRALTLERGSPGAAGQAAMFDRVFDRRTYEAGLDGRPAGAPALPSELCIPVAAEGQATALVNVSSMGRNGAGEDELAFCGTLKLVLDAACANLRALAHKDRQLAEVTEDKMSAEAKADFLRLAFARTVAPSVVEQIMRTPESFRTGGERRTVTVFYSDIRGFTSLSERISADAMVTLLNEYFEAMARLVFKHEGTIDKYIGDALMAFFGAPTAQADHARRAVQMAVDMQHLLVRLNERWRADGRWAQLGVPDYGGLHVGMGVNSGEVNVGFLGAASSRIDYTVIGDAVNTTARLVSKAAPGQIVVSRATADACAFGFRFRQLEPMQLKGKAEPVETFEVAYGPEGGA